MISLDEATVMGDPHAKIINLQKIEACFDYIESERRTGILLGDILDNKEIVRSSCLNTIYRRLKQSKLQYILMVGNHDYHNLECKDHSLVPLKELDNVIIVDKPQEIDGIYFVPYIANPLEFKKVMNRTASNIAFVHQGFTGFDYGNGHIAEGEAELDWIKDFELVISGHFHKYQATKNLIYLGTPFSHSFGESNQDKFMGHFIRSTCSLELIETPFPKHLTKTVNCDKELEADVDQENYIRFILTGTEENILKFDRKPHVGAKFIERPTIKELQSVIDESQSNEMKFENWAKCKKINSKTIELGLEILGDCA